MKPLKIALSLCLVSFMTACPVLANPSGEQVISGSASFDRSNPNVLNISTGDRVIINWQDFSINQGEMTKFLQPGENSAALNRVIGGNPSAILGTLSANGQIFLINPNGVLVGQGAHINTAGFVASTADVNNEQFMAGGNMTFVGNSDAKVVNLGKIDASSGDIVMIARQVENRGELNASKGGVYMAAGKEVLLAEKGKDRVFVKTGYTGASSVGDGVVNSGTIRAVHADLQAQGNIYAYAINNQGSVHATGAVNEGGRVRLVAGGIGAGAGNVINSGTIRADNSGEVLVKGNNVTTTDSSVIKAKTTSSTRKAQVKIEAQDTALVSGKIDVSSDTDKGGSIQVTGMKVGVLGLRADASGATGGGEILVGGDYQGKNPEVKNAQMTTVTEGTELIADAKDTGDGGKVVVWADDTTRFHGKISARGGTNGGNGGFAEVSGKENLVYRGLTDLRAFDGTTGILLLDPKNITVSAVPVEVNADFTNTVNNLFGNLPANEFTFLAADIVSNLNLASMVLQANNDIIISSDLIATNAANDLTLQAGRSIFIGQVSEATIMLGGAFRAIANDNDGAVVLAERDAGAGGFFMLPGSTIDTSLNGSDITIEVREGAGAGQQSGNIVLANLNSGAGDIFVTNSGNTAGSSILATNNSIIQGQAVDFQIASATPGANTTGSVGTQANPMTLITSTNAGVSAHGEGGGVYLQSANISGTNINFFASKVTTDNGGDIVLSSPKVSTSLNILDTVGGGVSNLNGGTISLLADVMFISNNVYSTERITVGPANLKTIAVGSSNFNINGLVLTPEVLDLLFTPVLQIGNTNAADITLENNVTFDPANVQTLSLVSSRSIVGGVSVSNLAFQAGGNVSLDVNSTRIAGRATGASSVSISSGGTNLTVAEVDGVRGIRTQNGNVSIDQVSGVINVSNTVLLVSEYDIDAGGVGSSVSFKVSSTNAGFFNMGNNARVRGDSGTVFAERILIGTNALLSIGSGGTLTADLMDVIGSIVAASANSEILINTVTKGGTVIGISQPSMGLYPIGSPQPTFTVTTVDGEGEDLSFTLTPVGIPGFVTYDVAIGNGGFGYTEPPTVTFTPPPAGGPSVAVVVTELSDGRNINLGSKDPGQLGLIQRDLDNIQAGNVRIGDTTSGAIIVSDNIVITAFDTLSLKTRADIGGPGTLTVQNLDLFATRGVTLTGENNVQTVTGNLRRNTFTFNNADSFSVGAAGIVTAANQINVQLTTTSGNIFLNGPISSGGIDASGIPRFGTVLIRANNGLFQNAAAGIINAGSSSVTIESDTINIGGAIIGNTGIYLRPNNLAANISINDSAADYNLTAAQLLLLQSTGGVEIGRTNSTGNVVIGSQGPVNLSATEYDLTVFGGSLTNRGNLTTATNKQFFAYVDAIEILSNITASGGITLAPRSDAVTIGLNDALGSFNLTAAELQRLTSSTVTIGRLTGTGAINIGSLGTINLASANSSYRFLGNGSPMSFNFQNPNDTFALGANQTMTIYTGGSVANSGLNNVDITIGGANGTLKIGTLGVLSNPNTSVNLRTAVSRLDGARTTGPLSIANTTNLNVFGAVDSANNNIFLSAGMGTLTSSSNGTINAGSASVTIESGSLNLLRTVTGTNSITLRPYADNVSIGINDTNGTYQLTAGSFGNLVTTNVNIGRATGTAPISIGGLGTINLSARNMNVNLLGADSDIIFNFTGNNSLILQNNRTFVFNTGGNISNPGGSTRDITIGGAGTVVIANAKMSI
ncbi:filamentous hemagglutinin N-terminal domain-containing protein [Oscillatoria laete-virens NRMC-F 0139]|nr:filamentous hemagglutinin N-terminal domain-containing protein [Oscillatoria laete-virens]MDL5053080.1 filamentous hemagglutinin N-terminal domain-containing protein [Oscillatoria laete-virens NRMC-F 0139]